MDKMSKLTSVIMCGLTGTVTATSFLACGTVKKEEVKKPMNIVYIMCDDHSFQTISAYDRRYMQTPNIDRIADEGVRFTNSFVANSLSGPAGLACLRANTAMPTVIPTTLTGINLTAVSRLFQNFCNRRVIRRP